jgi:short-subunit dehydrogenase
MPLVDLGAGTRVLVTGASRGIGEAMARAFASRGCTVGAVSRSGELPSGLAGDSHVALAADVGDPASIAAAVETFAPLDVLVANAGIAHYMPYAEMPLELVEELTRVNWLGTAYTVKAALPGMLERRRGQIVIVSSGAGLRSFPSAAVYGATKSAQRGFAEALRHELAGSGVSVTTVYPGQIRSSLHDHEKERMPGWYKLDASAPPEPLAEAVVEGVAKDRRDVFYPPNVRLLRIVHGLRPALADKILRRRMGQSAAPRR